MSLAKTTANKVLLQAWQEVVSFTIVEHLFGRDKLLWAVIKKKLMEDGFHRV